LLIFYKFFFQFLDITSIRIRRALCPKYRLSKHNSRRNNLFNNGGIPNS